MPLNNILRPNQIKQKVNMFSKILVANRGEIAIRIIRACKRLNIATVAVYSDADEDCLHVRLADESICIGSAAPDKSYLNIPAIISAAEISDVDAIHPGYGFLAENAHFADVCRSCNISFIGPSAEAMELMGNKNEARKLAEKAGVPILPGSDHVTDAEDALKIAHSIGYPVILKPSMGGGGRGMRLVHNDVALANSVLASRAEAERSFGNGEFYIEKFVEKPRHVEVQLLGDEYGNVIHLGERDCTVQRRHQKLVEESPCPVIDDKLRSEICEAAIKIAKMAKYTNAGTVEFILDEDQKFYFIEMNTRIQVEHTVTEMVTNLDLIEEQIHLAAGEPLRYRQEDIVLDGVAIECRINAEDPANNFAPSPGKVELVYFPVARGIRIDSHLYSGYKIPPYYDSLIAKLIVRGDDRTSAISLMREALDQFVIDGVKTNISFYHNLFANVKFVNGRYNTNFIEDII